MANRAVVCRQWLVVALIAGAGLVVCPPAWATAINLVPFASGFSQPVAIANAGDSRLFVVEKGGTIRVVQSNGTVLGTPFLDISALVSTGAEQGLLGLAFHPQYASNGFFYVHYTDTSGDTAVARYTVSGNPDVANPISAQPVFSTAQPFVNHNGGEVLFGPDSYLYIGLGDGGAGCDPFDNGQNLTTPLGKILRIDVDSGSPYAIPASNPFFGSMNMSIRQEIWAWGLRNPWRFSFDRSTGDLYIGDVGQDHNEEVDFEPAGGPGGVNYGWDCFEGNDPSSVSGCTTMAVCTPMSQFEFPVHQYDHSGGRCSIIGGNVYRGTASPSLVGQYFFADLCSNDIYSLNPGFASTNSYGVVVPGLTPTSFGEDSSGELYVTGFDGTVYRIAEAVPPPACPTTPASGCTGAAKSTFKLAQPGDPAKNKLIWKWLKGPAQNQSDLGDPVGGGTSYTVCVYAGTTAAFDVAIPGGTGWQSVSSLGYKFKDATAGGDGVFKALLKGGGASKSKVLVKAKGTNLDLSAMPLDASGGATVQLLRNDAPTCWEAVFPAGGISSDETQFKAKAP